MRIITLIIIVLSQTIAVAQDGRFERLYVTPGISVGYTFGATFNIGVDLDLTTSITSDFDKTRRAGISISHYLVLSKSGFQPHHISSLNLMFENDILDIKTGYSSLHYRWGLGQVNRGGVSAFNFDLSFTNKANRLPWFGIKSVFYNDRDWIWFEIPYFSVYARQKFHLTGGS